jgi:hypothetical protein
MKPNIEVRPVNPNSFEPLERRGTVRAAVQDEDLEDGLPGRSILRGDRRRHAPKAESQRYQRERPAAALQPGNHPASPR